MQDLSGASISINNLDTAFIGKKLFYFEKVISTNDIAKKVAMEGMDEGTVILADEQQYGRGRLKRSWLSPRGCIAVSVVLHPVFEQLPYIIMVSSLAVVRAIKTVTDIDAVIKWPNDVLINNKKVCGILVENSLRSKTV
ncbi:MAG: biotin--[acetyl-CoA-carboxylase] ligase, partial [Chloroflexi bacterium]|nr:biotin--[acetyl-CoA-carboxylase] ligase [Chloroflexota bacterium]